MSQVVQVAGIIDSLEADMLVEVGVDWLGFPLRLPSGRDDIGEAAAKEIIGNLPARREGVLITYLTRADAVAEFCDSLGCSTVQLQGEVSTGDLARLRTLRPDLRVLKSLVVHGDNLDALLAQARECRDYVDMFITDTFDPATGSRGATGMTHDWRISAELAARTGKPLMLAGGLRPGNVADAIGVVRPAGVDAHTALEGPAGRKDRDKVLRFVQEARDAFASL